jgi:hypothetical protein
MLTPIASPISRDGDNTFFGLQTRRNPLSIPPGYLQAASNIRLELGIPQARGGAKRIAQNISAGSPPVVVPFKFTLSGGNVTGPVVQSVYTGGLFGGGIFSSPLYNNRAEYLALIGPQSLQLWNPADGSVTALNYPISPISEKVQAGDLVNVVQAFEKLFLFRWRPSDIPLKIASISNQFPVSGNSISGTTTFTVTLNGTGFNAAQGEQITVTAPTVFAVSASVIGSSCIVTGSNFWANPGDSVTLVSDNTNQNSGAIGTFTVVTASSTQITYAVPNGTQPPVGNLTLTLNDSSPVTGTFTAVTASPTSVTYTVFPVGMKLAGNIPAGALVGDTVTVFSSTVQSSPALGLFALTSVTPGSPGSVQYAIPAGANVPSGSVTLQLPPRTVTMGITTTTATLSGLNLNAATGQQITVTSSLAQSSAALGTFTVISASATTVTYAVPSGTTVPAGVLTMTPAPIAVTASLVAPTIPVNLTLGTQTATVTTSAAHGYSTGEVVRISGSDQAGYNLDSQVTVTGTNTFTLTVPSSTMPNGSSNQYTVTGSIAGTTATITGTAINAVLGQSITVSNTLNPSNSAMGTFTVTAAKAGSISYTVPQGATFPSTGLTTVIINPPSLLAQRVCCPLYWDGVAASMLRVPTGTSAYGPSYSNMIAPVNAVAVYFNNQMILANATDQLVVSDVNDPFTYDPYLKSFRTNAGDNDAITALHPFANRQLVVFGRKTTYLATLGLSADGTVLDPASSSIQLLTNEIGCNARRSIATAGQFIYFLSDNGVYRLDNTQIDLALRGNTLPLSEPIDDQIQNINAPFVSASNAVYFNNRFYLAAPMGTSTYANTLFLYNSLNQAWESVDSYPFTIDALMVTSYNNQRRLFAVSYSGGAIFLLEQYTTGSDDASDGSFQYAIPSSITTRRFFWNQLNRKRFNSVAVASYLPAGSSILVSAKTINPDSVTNLTPFPFTNTTGKDNDFTFKSPIRRSADYLELTVTTSGGQPTIRAITADAATPIDPSRLARTEA